MKSILVIGLGRFGRHMALKLMEEGNEVLAIDKSEERANASVADFTDIQVGDATNEEFIASLGVDNFDICVVAIGDDFQTTLEITVLLKDYGANFIIARANRSVHQKLLLRNGADYVVYAEREMAERLAVKYGAKNIFDYIELTPEYSIYEISTPASWCGETIVGKEVRNRYKISILATKKNGTIYPQPPADHRFCADETLIIMGRNDEVKELIK